MTTNYFEKCKTEQELKATYKQLVKKFHPDVYGEKGNEILKEIHNQLEKAVKNVNVNYKAYSNFVDVDLNETEEQKELKKELAKEALKYTFAEGALFAFYWENNLRPRNHRNPLTKHNFSGWNIWTLELKSVLNEYNSCCWSTFAQYKSTKCSVRKGEKSTYITLAVISKPKDDEEENENKKERIFYKGYSVFNSEQVNDSAKAPESVKMLETKKQLTSSKDFEQKTLNLWQEKYQTIA